MKMLTVDLNADVGEGLDDEVLMPHLTSVSIACGGHAGDPATMAATLRAARHHGLRAGAHISYPDRAGFGRVEIEISPEDLTESLRQQMQTLAELAAAEGLRLTHLKAHGALYNRAWTDRAVADIVAALASGADPALAVFCPPGSQQEVAAREAGLVAVREVFLDRAYRKDGTLVPRSHAGAVISDPVALAQQVSNITRLQFETMCVHGDNPAALDLLRMAPSLMAAHGFCVAAYPISADADQ